MLFKYSIIFKFVGIFVLAPLYESVTLLLYGASLNVPFISTKRLKSSSEDFTFKSGPLRSKITYSLFCLFSLSFVSGGRPFALLRSFTSPIVTLLFE